MRDKIAVRNARDLGIAVLIGFEHLVAAIDMQIFVAVAVDRLDVAHRSVFHLIDRFGIFARGSGRRGAVIAYVHGVCGRSGCRREIFFLVYIGDVISAFGEIIFASVDIIENIFGARLAGAKQQGAGEHEKNYRGGEFFHENIIARLRKISNFFSPLPRFLSRRG